MPSCATTIPPVDYKGEASTANILLRSFRKRLDESGLNDEWRMWVVASFAKGEAERVSNRPGQRELPL